eukprot:9799138-Alexandrium_andersonii.AAC.1
MSRSGVASSSSRGPSRGASEPELASFLRGTSRIRPSWSSPTLARSSPASLPRSSTTCTPSTALLRMTATRT